MAGPSNPRPHIVEQYQRINNLSEWCDRRLATIHRGRYAHLDDRQFWQTFRSTLRQWADEQADPPLFTKRQERPYDARYRGRSWWREHNALSAAASLDPHRRPAA